MVEFVKKKIWPCVVPKCDFILGGGVGLAIGTLIGLTFFLVLIN